MYVDIICLLTGKLIDPNAVIVGEFKMNKYRQTTLDEFGFEFYDLTDIKEEE